MHTSGTTLSERLTSAVEGWAPDSGQRRGREGAARTFRRAMSQRLTGGRAGESYRAVLTYMNGESEPSLDWLRKAADVLAVRESWLTCGQGWPTEEVEESSKRLAEAFGKLGTGIRGVVRKALGAQDLSGPAIAVVMDLTMEYMVAVGRGHGAIDQEHQEVAEAIAAPIRRLGHEPARLPPSKYGHYVITVAEALRYLLADEPEVSLRAHTTTSDPGEDQ